MSRKLYAYDTCGGIFFRDEDVGADNRRPEFDLVYLHGLGHGKVVCKPDEPKTQELWISVRKKCGGGYSTHHYLSEEQALEYVGSSRVSLTKVEVPV